MVADVSGHGAPAAIVMAMIRAVLHTHPGVPDDPPAVLHSHQPAFPVSLGHRDVCHRGVRGARCGERYTPALVGRPSAAATGSRGPRGTASPSKTTTCLLWDELREVPCETLDLQRGDRLVFYTDGITDRQARDGSMYDPEQSAVALTRMAGLAPGQIVREIVSELDRFAGGHEPEDDQTMLFVGID